MKALIFIPAYNAEKSITDIIEKIPKKINKKDVVVVDDGSIDKTSNVAKKTGVTVLQHEKNKGYGAAQKTAYDYAIKNKYDVVVMVHSDGQHDPKQIPNFINKINKLNFDAVTGTRFYGQEKGEGMPLKKVIGNRLLSSLIRLLTGLKVSETHNGYRAYSLNTLKSIDYKNNSDKFEFDTEILLQIKSKKLKIGEIPIKTIYAGEKSHLNIWSYGFRILRVVSAYTFLRKYR